MLSFELLNLTPKIVTNRSIRSSAIMFFDQNGSVFRRRFPRNKKRKKTPYPVSPIMNKDCMIQNLMCILYESGVYIFSTYFSSTLSDLQRTKITLKFRLFLRSSNLQISNLNVERKKSHRCVDVTLCEDIYSKIQKLKKKTVFVLRGQKGGKGIEKI